MKYEQLSLDNKKILIYLGKHYPMFIQPTRIGKAVGGVNSAGVLRHSSWASPKLLVLVEQGFVERNDHGHYRIIERYDDA